MDDQTKLTLLNLKHELANEILHTEVELAKMREKLSAITSVLKQGEYNE